MRLSAFVSAESCLKSEFFSHKGIYTCLHYVETVEKCRKHISVLLFLHFSVKSWLLCNLSVKFQFYSLSFFEIPSVELRTILALII